MESPAVHIAAQNRRRDQRARGRERLAFTLVELAVVVLILGILAAVAAPRLLGVSDDASASRVMKDLDSINTVIEMQTAENGGEHPAKLKAKWFRDGRLPCHPLNTFGIPDIHYLKIDFREHPALKVMPNYSGGAYWYNTKNGIIRARVPDMGSYNATLDFYNRINVSNESSLGNY